MIIKKPRAGAVVVRKMKINGNDYTVGERQFILYQFLRKNSRKGKVATKQMIKDHLSLYDIQITDNTLYHDIAVLSGDVMGLQIEYDERKKGYWIKNPDFTPNELSLMVDSIQASKFITKSKADVITRKIRNLADTETASALNRTAVVPNRVRSMNESVVGDADRIYRAIEEDRKIGFRYFHYTPDRNNEKSYSKKGDRYKVSPYALSWNDGNFYLYAYVSEWKRFSYFRVDRMEDISLPLAEPRDGKDRPERDISTNPKRAKVFNMYSGTAYDVKIRFDNKLASAVIDQFGKDILMVPADNKHFTTVVPVEVSPPFYAWIATFGNKAKIVSPAPVVEGMRKFIQNVYEMYKDDGEM